MSFIRSGLVLSCYALLLAGCSNVPVYTTDGIKDGGPDRQVDINSIPNATPKAEPLSRYGNPQSYVVFGQTYHVLDSANGFSERGIASWYGNKFHGRRTSSGEPYDMYGMTAAHKSLPLPTYVEVTNIENGRKVIVKVNDRGPFHQNRIIDLSYVAAAKLDIARKGTGLVEIRALNPGQLHSAAEQKQTINSDNQAVKQAAASVEPALQTSRPAMQISTTQINPHPKMFIQTGAFGQRENALRLQQKIQQSLGQAVRISEVQTADKIFYRVQVGPLEAVEQVDAISEQLQNMGLSNQQTIIE